MNKYVFKNYDSIYPILYQDEKYIIEDKLGKDIVVEHIGSTAVLGLGGKGIIDIYIVVTKEKIKNTSTKLQELGYLYNDHDGKPPDWLFHSITKLDKQDCERTYHVHLVSLGEPGFKESILFRDYLSKNSEARKEYEDVKKLASDKVKNIESKEERKKVYMEVKGEVIKKLIKRAKEDISI